MRTKWLQRVMAIALTMAMCLTNGSFGNLGGIEVVKADETNLLTNGDFETDIWSEGKGWETAPDSWNNFNNAINTTTEEKKSGDKALGIWFANDNTSVTFSQTVTLEAGNYKLSGYAKETKGVTASVEFVGAGSSLAPTTDFGEFTGTIALESAGTYTVKIKVSGNNGAWVVLDDVMLVAAPVEETTVTVTNGDFETDIWSEGNGWDTEPDSWDNFNNAINTTTEEKKSGDKALGIWFANDNTSVTFSQTVTLEAGNYKLSGYAKETKGVTASVEFVGADSSLALTTDFGEFTGTIALESAGTYTIKIKVSGNNGAWVVLDDVTMKKTGDYIPPAYTYDDLRNLIASVPDTTGFSEASALAVTTALGAAMNCTNETQASEIANCYTALESAIAKLVYEDSTINVTKIAGLNDKTDFIKGVDISSYVTEVNSGVKYYDWNGAEITSGKDFVKLFAETGVNYIRIRVWNDPKDAQGNYYGGGNNDLDMAKKICGYIKEYNDAYKNTLGEVKVLVDLQYSDFWADPEKQAAPKAWKDMTIEDKVSNVKTFTKTCLAEIEATGVTVGMVQIGNETNTGICGTAYGTQEYLDIFKAGCDAVKEYNNEKSYTIENGKWIKRVVHFTDPQNASTTFAKFLKDGRVEYDVYATSYYPFWHGTTDNLKKMLSDIAEECKCEVMVAETQYVYTNEDYDGADNQAYEGKNNIDLSQWPVSVQGQANEIRDVMYAAANATNGIGMFYWEPAWLGVGNAYNEDGTLNETKLSQNKNKWEQYGSGWATEAAREYDPSAAKWGGGGTNNENASLFDFTGHPLASLNVFKYVNYGAVATTKTFYRAEPLDGIVVKMGTTAEDIKNALAATTNYSYNDGTTGTADITWTPASLTEVAKTISSTSAIGNYCTVEGSINVDGSEHKVTCEILVDPKENLLTNGGFEDSINGEWTFENKNLLWRAATEGAEYNKDANTRNGSTGSVILNSYFGGFAAEEIPQADSNGCYFDSISQTVENLPAGIYEAKGFFEGADEAGSKIGEKINISVTDGAGVTRVSNSVVLDTWMIWQSATVSNIVITDAMVAAGQNSITVSANVCIQKDVWGSIDDVYLYKVGEYTAPSGGSGSVTTPSTPTTPETPSNDDTTTTPDDTTAITNPDGTTTETKTETVTNEAGKEVEVTITTNKDAEGNVTGITETSVIENIVGKADATITVEKNAAGEITSAQAVVDKNGADTKTGVKATLSGSVVSQIAEAAGTESVEIVMTVTAGKKEYTIKADAADITAGNKLKVMAIDPKTGKYVLVNAKTYTVSKSGNVKVTLPEGATYQLLDSKDAEAVEKEILATVKVKKTSTTVKTGKKTTVQMSSKLDMDNVESITYSTSKKSVATVSKNGKVTAKKAGNVTIKVIVTLKNGQTKTVKMKVKVK